MPAFSKIIEGQRGSQQLVDTDGFIYSKKKPKDTALYSAWRCRKRIPPTKPETNPSYQASLSCLPHLSDNSLSLGSKPHNHSADNAAPQKREVLSAIREQQVITYYHIDRLGVGKTPSKKRIKRKTSNNQLFHICSKYSDCSSKVDYMFEIAKYFGHEIDIEYLMYSVCNYYVGFELSLS